MNRIEKLKEFLAGSPGDSFLLHALALEHVKIGDDEQARPIFEQLLAADPAYTGSYYHLGKLLERSGDPDSARRVYQTGMEECKKAGDLHALNELRNALEEITEEH